MMRDVVVADSNNIEMTMLSSQISFKWNLVKSRYLQHGGSIITSELVAV